METEAETKVYELKKKINQALDEQFGEDRTKVYHPALVEKEPIKPVVIKPILPVSKTVTRKEGKVTVLKHKRKFDFLKWVDDHSWKIAVTIPLCFIIMMSLVALFK